MKSRGLLFLILALGLAGVALAAANARSWVIAVAAVVLAVWMGLYPSPFLRRLESSVNHIINRVNTDYASACGGGTPAPAAVADSSNVARFLTAAPCGPDGKPLAAPAAEAPGVPR